MVTMASALVPSSSVTVFVRFTSARAMPRKVVVALGAVRPRDHWSFVANVLLGPTYSTLSREMLVSWLYARVLMVKATLLLSVKGCLLHDMWFASRTPLLGIEVYEVLALV